MSYVIVDMDETLTTTGDTPNQKLIDHLNEEVMRGDIEIIIVSARSIDRLEETRAWLLENKVAGVEDVFLNDFEGTPFATDFAFKEYKYAKLKEEYGDELIMAIDNDPAVRTMAAKLGITAHSPEEHVGMRTDEEDEEYRAPAPPEDQIKGSDKNPEGSASGKSGDIELSDETEASLQTKSDDHNEAMTEDDRPSWTRVRVDALRSVYRRGAGAFSVSHRPGMQRNQWAMGRVNAFLFLARTGAPENENYVQDNDLLNTDHPKYSEQEERATYAVPNYVQSAARKGLEWHDEGLSGDGLQPRTVREAEELAANRVTSDKLVRLAAWIRRHRGDWEGVPQNSNRDDEKFPGPGAVAAFLWGVDTTDADSADRVLSWADKLNAEEDSERFDMKEIETRSVALEEFRLAESDGQKVFVGYAATYGQPSAGLPFKEIISAGAFKRTLARVANDERVVKFLHGHDESRMLASTASGRLTLVEDEKGLRVEAKLDPADPDAAAIISKLTHEAKAMGMSFGFTVPKGGDAWSGETRTLNEINLFEVSILSGHQPAYPSTLGLSAVRKLAEARIGVDAERLLNTLETVKAGKSLTDDEVEVIDAVRSALAPKPVAIDQSVAAAKLLLAQMENESL